MACWHSDFLFEGRKRGDEDRHTVNLILTLSLCPLCRSRGTILHDDAKHLHGQFQLLSSRQWCAIPRFRTDCSVSGFVPVCIWTSRIDPAHITTYIYPWRPTSLLSYLPLRESYWILYCDIYWIHVLKNGCLLSQIAKQILMAHLQLALKKVI